MALQIPMTIDGDLVKYLGNRNIILVDNTGADKWKISAVHLKLVSGPDQFHSIYAKISQRSIIYIMNTGRIIRACHYSDGLRYYVCLSAEGTNLNLAYVI